MTIEPDNIYLGHALAILKEMPGGLVDCIITSPPYWGLRDYQLEPIVWDAKEGCEHVWQIKKGTKNVGRDDGFYGGIVLDPFSGMSTVASVAIRQGKHFVMIEASPEYAGRAKKRIDLEKQQMKLELK